MEGRCEEMKDAAQSMLRRAWIGLGTAMAFGAAVSGAGYALDLEAKRYPIQTVRNFESYVFGIGRSGTFRRPEFRTVTSVIRSMTGEDQSRIKERLLPNQRPLGGLEITQAPIEDMTLSKLMDKEPSFTHTIVWVMYGTREQIEGRSLYRSLSVGVWPGVMVEHGAQVQVDPNSDFNRMLESDDYRIRVRIHEQDTICTSLFWPPIPEPSYTFSYVYIERGEGEENCLLKHLLYKVGFTKISKDLYVDRRYASDDLSDEIDLAFDERLRSGMSHRDFLAIRDELTAPD